MIVTFCQLPLSLMLTSNMDTRFYKSAYKVVIFFAFFFSWISFNAIASTVNNAYEILNKFPPASLSSLPNYVVANISNLQAIKGSSIRIKAPLCNFPLTEQDKVDLKVLETKFDNEEECAGLAAPQIGISKRFIVFKVEKEDGVEDAFAKTIWINPVYEKASDVTEVGYEQCFSVLGVTAPVRRYKHIRYRATDINGKMVEGRASGWAARVIQHETDHLDGILFIDLVPSNKIITLKEFRRKLKAFEDEDERNRRKTKLSQPS